MMTIILKVQIHYVQENKAIRYKRRNEKLIYIIFNKYENIDEIFIRKLIY